MNREAIDELIRRWTTEAVGEGRTPVFEDLLSEDVRDISGATESRGRQSFIARAQAVRSAFADVTVRVDDLLVDGDGIAWRWTLTGTHVAPFLDAAATGKRVALRGVNFQQLRDGRVAEHWTLADLAGLGRQLRGDR